MTLIEFVVGVGMEEDARRAFGAIRAGRYSVGAARRSPGGAWALERPFGCERIVCPSSPLRTPCVVRRTWKTQKAMVAE